VVGYPLEIFCLKSWRFLDRSKSETSGTVQLLSLQELVN